MVQRASGLAKSSPMVAGGTDRGDGRNRRSAATALPSIRYSAAGRSQVMPAIRGSDAKTAGGRSRPRRVGTRGSPRCRWVPRRSATSDIRATPVRGTPRKSGQPRMRRQAGLARICAEGFARRRRAPRPPALGRAHSRRGDARSPQRRRTASRSGPVIATTRRMKKSPCIPQGWLATASPAIRQKTGVGGAPTPQPPSSGLPRRKRRPECAQRGETATPSNMSHTERASTADSRALGSLPERPVSSGRSAFPTALARRSSRRAFASRRGAAPRRCARPCPCTLSAQTTARRASR